MRKTALTALALMLALTLFSCGQSDRPYVTVYWSVAPYYRTDGGLIRAEKVAIEPGVGLINATIAAFNSTPSNQELKNPMPTGVIIAGYSQSGEILRIEVSSGYSGLKGPDLAIANSCIVMTFCGISGVKQVSIVSGGKEICPPMSPDDILLSDTSA